MLYKDSCSYDGQWRGGLRHGSGVLSIPSGVLRTPEGDKGARQDEGVVTVDGQWVDDMPCQNAEWGVTFPTGDKYLGSLKLPSVEQADTVARRAIVPHGWGLCKLKTTGEVYKGQWMDGMRHGKGVS